MRTASGWRRVRSRGAWEPLREVMAGHGERDLLRRSPLVAEWARAQWPTVVGELSTVARPISGMWFDKQLEANWRVPWHQDVHIPVTPCSVDGWGPWSQKDGMPYVVAPEPWSSRRIALRLHLDACAEDNGPLQIIPGSHRHGRLSAAQIDEVVATGTVITVVAEPGEVLIMHPLLLHRSAPARQPCHRRVIHVEWCDAPLPPGAMWLDAHP
jgi:hypothetical protein